MPTRAWPTSEPARTTRSDCRRDLPTGFVCRRGPLPSDCENEAQLSLASQSVQVSCLCGSSLFAVADQCIAQTVLQRAKLGLVIPPLEKPVVEDRLTDLL